MYLFYFIFLLFLNIKILERANLTGKSKFQCAFLLILFILLYFLWNPTIHEKSCNT